MLKAISTITNALGALNYKGTWNAATNTPTLADGTGAKGDYYVVSTAGTQTFNSIQLFFGTGDWIAYNGAVWQRVEGGSDGNFANVTMTSTDAGAAAAPTLDLYRDSASPAASDTLGEIEFNGEDSAGNKQVYGLIHASILSPTTTAEQGQLHFETATAGALTEKMIIGTTNLVINEIGAVFNVRIEGDTDANLFYTDATNSRIGIGTITPSSKLQVSDSTNGGAVEIIGTNTYFLAASIDESVSFQGEFFQNDLASNRAAGYMRFTKVGDFSNNANASANIIFATRNAGTLAEKFRIDNAGNVLVTSSGGLGYGTGSGGTVTQATSRTTGVTLNKTNGAITLVSGAGLATFQSFTVTNSTVAATDVVHVTQKSGTDLYQIFVTATAAGSFKITFATTGGVTVEQPVFNFAVIKGVTA